VVGELGSVSIRLLIGRNFMLAGNKFCGSHAPLLLLCLVLAVSCRSHPGTPAKTAPIDCLIPTPASVIRAEGKFLLQPWTNVLAEGDRPEIRDVGEYLAARLRPATGFPLEVRAATADATKGDIRLTAAKGDPGLDEEGYELKISPDQVLLSAFGSEGLFRGVQTIRQLLPAAIEKPTQQAGPWEIAAGTIKDRPRFAWRGAMLDVARHFFKVSDVRRYIDEIAYYKLNRLHLHLSDDQGWRIEIKSWPRLATYGGSLQVGGGPGGYYTRADYKEIAAYARSRYIMVIPEIDMPGHTNAALASYAGLNCNECEFLSLAAGGVAVARRVPVSAKIAARHCRPGSNRIPAIRVNRGSLRGNPLGKPVALTLPSVAASI
jgi:hexosaminidase